MLLNTFIKLDRSIENWRWFKNQNTLQLWIYILLNANITDHDFDKIMVHRGELVTSYESLSKATGMSLKEVRTALTHLKETGEVAVRIYPKYSVISVVNYNLYQGDGQATGKVRAEYGQTTDRVRAGKGQQYNKEIKKECNNEIMKECVEQKHPHGKLNNVYITDSEYETFRKEYPAIADSVIDELSEKIATGDRRYADGHIGHLFVFARNYTPEKKQEHKPSYDFELAIQRSLNIDPTKTKRGQ